MVESLQRSTLFPLQRQLGATFHEVAGWELPQHFGALEAEYEALRQGAGLSDMSYCGLVRMTGKDRQRFLHAMVSNDTASLQPGQGCYATFLDAKGHVITDLVVYATEDAYLLELAPQAVRSFLEAIEFFIISEDVVLTDESGRWGWLAVLGPQAIELLDLAFGQEVPDLPLYGSAVCQLGGQEMRLLHRRYTRDTGYVLLATPEALPGLWGMLWEQQDVCPVRAVGTQAIDIARIEDGIPVYGQDITASTIPIEANLQTAISYTKGCYIGQEVIARIDARGHVNRQLTGLLLEGPALPAPGAKIMTPQREVGWITSVASSLALRQNIALGYVRREMLSPGTRLTVQDHGMTSEAIVTSLPFAI